MSLSNPCGTPKENHNSIYQKPPSKTWMDHWLAWPTGLNTQPSIERMVGSQSPSDLSPQGVRRKLAICNPRQKGI